MSFHRIADNWQAEHLFGEKKGDPLLIRGGSWCWVEEPGDESGLVEVGECATIEDATRLEDDEGNEVPGGLDRAQRWEALAKQHGLQVPQHLEARRPRKRRRTKEAHGS